MCTTGLFAEIDALGLSYSELNQRVRIAVESGARRLVLRNVAGQRYIGTNLYGCADRQGLSGLLLEIHGTPGNDLGAFLDGPTIVVYGNAMDGTGNTMTSGRIVIHGRAGDITGLSARGGEIFVRDSVGYRTGVHMKQYQGNRPVIVIGGTSQDFLGEYMAGGIIILLGLHLKANEPHACNRLCSGMHGGAVFVRGTLRHGSLGHGVSVQPLNADDRQLVAVYVSRYAELFGADADSIMNASFTKLVPATGRPYKQLYAY
ncbi:MAG: hypothetical protein QHI38_04165 [Armatimonadota bacterium]|nr:hypothetical protein [Armatimonadota bacterium]